MKFPKSEWSLTAFWGKKAKTSLKSKIFEFYISVGMHALYKRPLHHLPNIFYFFMILAFFVRLDMINMKRILWRLWFLGFDRKISQFLVRTGNVGNYGFNFTLRHPLNLWKAQNDTLENLVLGLMCIGPKYFRAEVLLGPKCASGLSMLGAKVV